MLLTLPCAGIIRTGSKGVLSPGCRNYRLRQPGPLALDAKLRRNFARGNPEVISGGSLTEEGFRDRPCRRIAAGALTPGGAQFVCVARRVPGRVKWLSPRV